MQDSLKSQLQEAIKKVYPNHLSYSEFLKELERINDARFTEEEKRYKPATAERRLRHSDSPMIETLYNSNRSIKGFMYIQPKVYNLEPEIKQGQGQLFPTRRTY
jgi:hypothetical protein